MTVEQAIEFIRSNPPEKGAILLKQLVPGIKESAEQEKNKLRVIN